MKGFLTYKRCAQGFQRNINKSVIRLNIQKPCSEPHKNNFFNLWIQKYKKAYILNLVFLKKFLQD